ncbi:vitamin K epoxide reductase family protein [Pedobacter sp. R-06]|uniref:vitamin K epoxide reductase family protein n=1 Tax=Pedobacter sp. R-06 TaxID=3404051 RepID=UPI003CE9E3B0
MNLYKRTRPNLESILIELLKNINVKVTQFASDACLQAHPEYPSLLAVSDCLNEWDIDNKAYKLSKDNYNTSDFSFPFIAHLKEDNGKFLIINSIGEDGVNYTDENKQNGLINEKDFLTRWDGIILYAQKKQSSGEKGYLQTYLHRFLIGLIIPFNLILSIVLFSLIISSNPFSWGYLFLSILKFIGVGFSVLLLIQSIDNKNPLVQNLCGLNGKNDCNVILKSDAAQPFSWISWSEIGFFYFIGSLIAILALPSSLNIIVDLNILALPYTIYSISYQYRNKNWCVLCCAIQLILWLEFVNSLMFDQFSYFSLLNLTDYVILSISFLIPILFWFFLKPYFLKASELIPVKQQLKKFKHNASLFNHALMNQPRYAINEDLMPIVVGDSNSETVITMVSNPFCEPCGKAHKIIDSWIKAGDDLQLKILFVTGSNDDDRRTKVARHITALANLDDENIAGEALNDWYGQGKKEYENWAKKYPIKLDDKVKLIIEKQKAWCEMTEITSTPTIFVNGYKLPAPYKLDDIRYLMS